MQKKIAFLFPGQGSQYVGMGKEIYDNYKVAKYIFDRADKVMDFSVSDLCFNGPEDKLSLTEYTQPAILTVSISIMKVLYEKGIYPDVTAGLSLGEYSALVCSKVIGFEETLKLVRKRGIFMQQAAADGKGKMAAIIGLDRENIIDTCVELSKDGVIEVANYNCPGQIVIAGEIDLVTKACEILKKKGAKRAILLNVSGPFHTSMLKSASDYFKKELDNVEFGDIKIPYITNVDGNYVNDKNVIKELLTKQIQSSVYWEDSIRRMLDDNVNTFIEIGPSKTLSSFVRKVDKNKEIYNVENINSLNKLLKVKHGLIGM